MTLRVLLGWNKPFDLRQVKLPVFASYKLDGWRARRVGSEFFSRNGKTIPNRYVQKLFEPMSYLLENLDGELIVGDPADGENVFPRTDKLLKTHYAPIPPEGIRWFVFDNTFQPNDPFWRRIASLIDIPPLVYKLEQVECRSIDDIEEFEARALNLRYEGICLRSPTGIYKYGRSTFREQYLLKRKPFLDGEATVVGFVEAESNQNEATLSPTGYTTRSSHKAGQVPVGVLGSLEVEMGGVRFRVGTGFSESDRVEIWRNRDRYLGARCTIKYSPTLKDKPRQPRFKGFRSDL